MGCRCCIRYTAKDLETNNQRGCESVLRAIFVGGRCGIGQINPTVTVGTGRGGAYERWAVRHRCTRRSFIVTCAIVSLLGRFAAVNPSVVEVEMMCAWARLLPSMDSIALGHREVVAHPHAL